VSRHPRLVVPPAALVLLVGAAGSGKTTLAARHFAPAEILSSDAYRAKVSGDPTDQTVTREAFRRLHAELERRMAAGTRTVVDATNVQPWARRRLRDGARRHGREVVALVLALPLEVCLARNAARKGRPVPPSVIRDQDRALQRSVLQLAAEGYASVVVMAEAAQVDDLEVVLAEGAERRAQRNVPKERHPAL